MYLARRMKRESISVILSLGFTLKGLNIDNDNQHYQKQGVLFHYINTEFTLHKRMGDS